MEELKAMIKKRWQNAVLELQCLEISTQKNTKEIKLIIAVIESLSDTLSDIKTIENKQN
jgi:hypothetical protein